MESLNKYKNKEEKEGVCNICNSVVVHNGVFCKKCLDKISGAVKFSHIDRSRLKKSEKRKLWKERGRICEKCGFSGGGRTIAVHPFKPAEWNGELKNVKILCSQCLGEEASMRDKILKIAQEKVSLGKID